MIVMSNVPYRDDAWTSSQLSFMRPFVAEEKHGNGPPSGVGTDDRPYITDADLPVNVRPGALPTFTTGSR